MNIPHSFELEIHELELALLRPEVRKAGRAEQLLADDFFEFGSSGHVFNKAEVLTSLKTDPTAPRSVDDMRVRRLAPDAVLVTYRAYYNEQPSAESLRSSVWMHKDGRWQMVFHQGTPCPTSR